jgi:hypothetical protein
LGALLEAFLGRETGPLAQSLGGGSTRSIRFAAVVFSPGSQATLVVMAPPTASEVGQRLRDSYALDLLWGETMGLPPGDTKEGPLRQVISVLEAAHTAYALIGGVALQLHSEEPRTTLDIDLAVPTFADIPVEALESAGFEHEQRFPTATIGGPRLRAAHEPNCDPVLC